MILNEYWTLPTGRYARLSGRQARPRLGLGVTRASLAALLLCLLAPLLAPPEALAQSGGTGLTISANETEFPESTAEDPRRPQVVLSASDVGGTATRLTLEPSLDSGQFTLGASSPSSGDRITATLSFIDPPDYENPTDAATPVGDAARDNIYLVDVTLNVRSGGSDERPTDTTRIRIRITPVDEYDPVLTNDRTHHRVNENIRGYFVQFHSTDADADGGPIRHEIVDDPVASPDRAHFRLVAFGTPGEVLYFRLPPDYEAPNDEGRDNIYNITVRATSGSPPRTSEPLALTIEISDNRREKSVIVNTRGTVVQNRTYEFRTGYAGVIDTFTIEGGDAGAFSFNPLEVQLGRTADLTSFRFNPSSGELSFSGPAPNATNNLRLSATNTSGGTVFASFSVRANHRAFGIRAGQRFPLPENSDPPQVQFAVTDPDDVPPHVRLFDSWDADLFTLESTSSGGTVTATLRFKTQPDFENPIDTEVTPNRLNPTNDAARNNIYLVRIGITEEVDSNGFVGAGYDVRIVVTNVDDGPTLFATEPTYEVPENTTEPIVTLRGIDADADTLRYEIVDGAASPDRDHFFLHRSTGVLRFASAQNFEEPSDANEDGTYHITVQATSGNPSRSSNRQTLRIRLTDGDDRVSVLTTTQATYEAPENTTDLIATLQGESVDGGGLRFEIAEGDTLSPDRAHFDLDPLSGELRFKDPQDFEAPSDVDGNGTYHIAVQATSSNPPRTSSPLALAITLTDDDDNDPTITPTQATYNFLTETMGTIATFTIEDDDADEARAFSALEAVPASGTNLTAFDFDPGSGVLSFQDPAVNATSRLIIRGTSGDKTAMLAITIAVMSDSPPAFAATEFTLPEDRNPPQVMLSATDADDATVALTLTNTQDSTLFTLEDSLSTGGTTTANLRFIDPPDFEAPADTATAGGDAAGNNIYLVRVRARSMNLDGVVVRTNETIRITVTNIDDNPPTLTNTETDHPVAEGRTDTFLTLVGSDADEDDSVRFTKSGGADVAHFTLDGTSGALRFASAPDFENPRGTPLSSDNTNTYHLSVQAESGTGQTTKTSPALALTIRVTPVDEDTPRITASTGLTTYNFLTGTTGPIATFTIEDSDAGEAHAFSALEAGPASGTDLADFSFNTDTGVLSFQGSAANATSRLIIRGTSNTKPAMLAITIRVADELVLNAPVNQNYTMNTAITDLALPEATGGTAPLTYTLTSVPGLTFNADTRRLSGTPDTAGTTTLTYEVMDANNASTTATFMVIVSDSLALTASGNQNYTQGTAITALTLPAATGGTAPLTYTLTGPGGLPGGLEFDADTRTLSGTPTNTASTFDLTYEVTDDNGASTNATFRVVIALRLRLSAPVNQNYTQGTLITGLELPEARGGREPLTYTLTGPGDLLGGLEFDADTRTLSGTPNTAGTTTLTYEVTDTNNASTSVTFTVIVNASLTLDTPANQNYTLDTETDALTLPAATGGRAPLTYTLTSVPGLTFTANTRILSGTPNTAGTTTLTYEVMDANGTSASVDFMVIVSDSLALTASGNQNYTLGTTIPDLQLPAATGGTAPLTYTLFRPGDGNLPGGLNFNANTRTLSGTPTTAGASALTYRVSDANGASTSVRFTVIVNASLTLTASGNQNYTQGAAITALTLPAATGGTAPLTYTLTRPGGLPGGLEFDADTRTLSGTLANTASTFDLTYEVTDDNGASTNATFRVVIALRLRLSAPVNQNYTQGTLITGLELPEARGGREPLTYTLTGPGDLLGGLEFDADTRTLSGTPNTAGTTTLTYEVTDTNNASTSVDFMVIVSDSLALTASGNQNYTLGTTIPDLQLPAATGGTAPLTYTLFRPGDGALPGGLNFNANTRTLSGTPTTAGASALTYRVSDANGASTSVGFTVIVNASLALTASGNQNYTQGAAITALTLPAATGGTAPLTYTLTGPGGLPGGLEFDADTRTLSGTLANTASTFDLTYEVTDDNGASTNATFRVVIALRLRLSAPVNQNYTQGTLITGLELPEARGGREPLTYTLTGPGDSALPGGLTFTPDTRTLSGTPNTAATTTLTYEVTDDNGANTSVDFTVTVNDGLALTASGNQNYTLDTAITDLQLPVATGGTGTLQYTLTGPGGSALPGGLEFDPGTRTLSGTPNTAATTTLTYEVTDDNGASTNATFTVIVSDGLALSARGNQNYTRGTLIPNLPLPEATGGTAPLTYTLAGPGDSALPGGLTFTPGTRTLSGTPSMAATTTLTYRVTDTNGASTNATFTVIVSDGLTLTASGDQNYTRGTAITALELPVAAGGTAPLTYTLTSVPGLSFNANTRILSGTPNTAGTTTLTYEVSDANNASTTATFMVTVNASLTLTAPANQNYTQGAAITALELPVAAGGTVPLTYTLTSVPGGLTFTPATRTLSGTPDTDGDFTLTYRVTDANGASTSVDFTVTVNASLALDTPANQNYTQGTAITDLELPAATGGTAPLTYTLTSVPGLNFTPGTRTLSGTPNTADTTTLTYEVTDDNGASTTATFTVTVNASLALTASGNQNYTLGTAITALELPVAAGGTAPLTYTLTSVPGLDFNANNRTLSGTPTTADTTELTYTATDDNGSTAMDTFTVIVAARVAVTAPNDQTYTMNTTITGLALPEATGGTGTVTYTLAPLPDGLTFTATTRVLSGTPTTAGTTELTYIATDDNGSTAMDTFTVIVAARVAVTAPNDQTYTMNTAITDLALPEATGGTGTVTYTLAPLPDGLTFTATTRVLSGTPNTAATTELTYTATDDNGSTAMDTFTVIVAARVAVTAPNDQTYTMDTAITGLALPEATGGTAPLTYTLTSVPGLEFDADTRILSGTPSTAATTNLTYRVTDDNGASTTATFTVIVSDSLALTASANQNYTQGRAITDLTLPAATGGTAPLTYTLTSVPGLTFNADTRILSGTPSTAATTNLTYAVSDANGASTTATFTVIVSDSLALTASGNQNYTLGTAITALELPVAAGGTAPLTYTLTSVPGLEFDAATRTLSGTPNTAGTTTLTYRVTDDNGASTSVDFMVIVNASLALDTPANQNYTRGTAITDLELPVAAGGTAPLTYTLTSVPGLSFNANTRILSGTPSTAATTTLTYEVSDANNASTTATFMVTVNASLTLTASGNQNYTLGTAITALELPVAAGGTVPLTYTLTSVPGGLTFTPATRTLSGTPDTDGDFTLTYRVTDDNGASTSVDFMVIVNASLALDTPANQNYTRGTAITDLELPVAAGGTAPLTYTLTSVPGLEFDANNRTLSGTPNTAATTELTYIATDDNGSTAMDTFTVTVADEVEVTAPNDQTYTMDTAITDLGLPMATGGTGTVTYTLTPLPNGLIFNADTRVLSGTPTAMETVTATYTATDDNGSTAMDTFTVIVAAGVAVTVPVDQTYTMNTAITDLTLDPATGGTGTVTYTLAPLPDGLTFTAGTRVLSGTPTAMETVTATYIAMDTNGASQSTTFTITVADEVEVTAPNDQTYTMGTAITALTLTPATGGTTPVTYTLAPLPNGLLFNATTRVLSGTPNTTATTELTYTATDDNGSTAMDTFTVTVADEVEVTAPGDQTYTMDTAITDLSLPMATGGTAPLTYTLTSVPGLNFNAGTRTLSGTPSTADTTTLTYEVTDTNGASTNATFTVTVNASLTLTASGNQTYTMDTAITALSLPMATGGTEPLTYTLTSVPGLNFIPGTRTLSGTPSTPDTTTLTYEVTDNNGANTSVDFTVRVNASLTLDTPDDQNYTMDTAITDLTLDPATGGTTPVTYTLTGPSGAALATAIPGLNFDANNRTLSGTPNATATTVLTYTATDDNGSTAMDTFTVIVAAGVAVTAPGDQTYTMDTAITALSLPMATGGTEPLTYALTGPGDSALPGGLSFNANTRTLSGAPSTPDTTTLTYEVTDDNGASTSVDFTVIVNASLVLDTPANQNYTMDTAITDLTLDPATGGTTPVAYTLTGPSGAALATAIPGLNFDANNRTLSGTPNTTATTVLTYTATDDNGSTAMDTFTVTVAAGVAVTAPGDQTYTMGTAITDLTLPEAAGGTTPVTYTLAPLPNGLTFTATTRVLSGTPDTDGNFTLTYRVTDDNGASTSVDFTVIVNASLVLDTPANQNYTMDTAITALSLPMATGGTEPLTYTLTGPGDSALPGGLSFNANTRTLSGAPSTPDTTTLTYMVTDDNGASTSVDFTVIVNASLTLDTPDDQNYTMDTAITDLTLDPATGGTTPVAYTLTGPSGAALATAIPGLNFDANNRTLSGTPNTTVTTVLTYTATDDNGSTAMDTFTVTVADEVEVTAPGDQTYTMDTAITALTLDPATGGTGAVTYTLTPLPNGLIFNETTRVLSGTPTTADTTELTYTATDDNGSTAMDTFTVIVAAGVAVTAPGDQTYTMDTAITALTLAPATGGTTPVTYTLTPLPNGLLFNATTRVLSGTPNTTATTELTYTVTDDNGSTAMDTFTVTVADEVEVTAPVDQTYTMDTAITDLTLSEAAGGTTPVTYTLAPLPNGLTFTAATRVLSGTPSTADTTTLTYMVTDDNGASTTATFMVIVNASLTLTASGNQNYTQGRAITALPLPEATGGTAPLTYTLTGPGDGALPGGLTFGTRTLSGTPDMAATTTLTYEVMDANGASTSVDFTVIVSDGLALTASANQNYTLDTAITDLTLPAATGGTGTLTYTLTGPGDSALPGGLTFGTRTLSGTPNTAATTTLTYAVTDTNGASTSVDFTVIVSDGLALTASANQNYTLDTAITDLQLPAATGGTGTLTYTLTSVPGLTFNANNRTLSGTPSMAATTTLTYEVTDTNGASTSVDFTVIVSDGLALTASGDQNYTLDTAITGLTLPPATGGTAPLTYTLTSVPGLDFDPGTRILSGTPTTAGTTLLTYMVSDTNGASTSVGFTVMVSDGLALSARGNQNYTLDTEITGLELPAATGGTGTLQYTLTGPGDGNLPAGLDFNANTRILSGTPTTDGTTTLTYRVSDANGASTTATFMVTVNASLTLTASGNQNYTQNTLIPGLELPAATGGTTPVTYTLAPLPDGLTFTASTRVLSGTPTAMETVTATYTAMDSNGASQSTTFTITVADEVEVTAPNDQTYTMDTAITALNLPMATGGTGTLTYTLTGPGGLPAGLTFTPGTRILSGTPNTAATTTLTYEVMDANGASTSVGFTVMVSDGLALTASGNQNYTLDTTITGLTLPEATGGTGTLTYTLTSVPGLDFDPGTRILSGTPTTAATTTLTYEVTDANNASTNATFTVIVSDGLALSASGDQNYTLDTEITGLELPVAAGGTGTLTYTLTSVPGLDFDVDTRTLSGTPDTAGTFDLTYAVSDTNNASTSVTFTVIVSDGLALSASGDQNYTLDTEITGLELPVAAGGTAPLTYTLTSVPGLDFDVDTRTLSGTPDTAGTTLLTYRVSDANGASTSVDFTVMVNDGLTLTASGNQNYTLDTAITGLELPVATGGTVPLTYTLTGPGGSALPAGLTFDTRTLSGTPDTAGTTLLTYRVSDANGASTSVDFTVMVNDGLTLTASGNQNYTLDTAITGLELPVATGGTVPLTYTLTGPGGSALPAGLTFTPGTRTLSGTPSMVATTTLTYMVTDTNNASTSVDFMVTVNASLTLTASGNQTYTMDTAITALSLPMATGGTGTLTYTLTGPGDSALPAGLTFNTRTLSGTPNTAGTTTLTYMVTDTNNASTSVDFTVIVSDGLALTASGDQNYTQGRAITALQLPIATGGTGTLTYTLTGPGDSALPAGLTFNTRTLSGTPNTAGTTTLTYMVTDTNNASTSVDFTVTVNASLALTASGNQNYTLDTEIPGLELPVATGGTGTLTYTLTSVPGLNFNAGTRTLSGTPDTAGTTVLTYMVSDANNASTNTTFTVTVNASLTLTASGDQNYTLDTEITGLELPVATGGTGIVTYTLAPLPNGLIFNATTRVLSGTPTTADTTELTYIATDDNGSTAMDTFTLTVDNADAPPAFVETTFSQVENTTPTLTLAATEADGDDVSFTLQSDGDATYFTLTDGGAAANTATLIFRDAPNFESPQGATLLAGDDGIKNTYQMNVQAASTTSPNVERTTTQIITINVTDADDPPTFTTAASALTIMEGDTTMTAMIEAIDQDGDSVTLALTGGADQARLRLTGATLSFISTPDFETPTDADANNIYEAEITASSTSSTGFTATDTATGSTATGATALSAVRTFNITVTDADDNAPELTSSTTFQIQSGETAVATLEATDADSGDTETIVFALSGGADQSQFALTRAGVLSFTSAADFTEPTDADADNIYEAEITLTSGSRPHTTQAALEIEVISIDRQSRRRIGNVILAHIARSLADNTQDTILARTSGRLTNNLELSNRQGDLDDLIKGIQGFSFMQRLDAKQAAGDATAATAAAAGDADATGTTTKERGFALWAKGRIRTFSASPNERAINNFSGHTYNLNLGADYQTGALLFGGLITASQSNVKFTSGSAEGQGKIRTKLTTFAPFMHFRLKGGTELWGSASFGQGRMHYQSETTDDGFESTDLKYAQVAGGLYQPLKALKKTNLALRVDGYTARLKADAFEDVFLAMAGDVSRVRALFEVGYRSQGVGNGVLDAKLNGGARLETGDIGKGVGLEFGVEITYANPASGLSVSADVNAILLHTAQKYRHLDAGLRFLLDPGAKKRGLQFRLEPRIGSTTPVAPLWDGALVNGSASPNQQLGTSALGQLQTALGLSYGFAARQSLLTPFTEMRLDDRGAPIDLMLGVRLSRANHPINITLYTQKVFRNDATGSAFGGGAGLGSNIGVGTTPGVHLKLNWR